MAAGSPMLLRVAARGRAAEASGGNAFLMLVKMQKEKEEREGRKASVCQPFQAGAGGVAGGVVTTGFATTFAAKLKRKNKAGGRTANDLNSFEAASRVRAAVRRHPRRCRRRQPTMRRRRRGSASQLSRLPAASPAPQQIAGEARAGVAVVVSASLGLVPRSSTTLGIYPVHRRGARRVSPLHGRRPSPLAQCGELMSPGPPASPPHWGAAARKGSLSKTLANAPATKLAALLAGASAEPSPVDDELEPPLASLPPRSS